MLRTFAILLLIAASGLTISAQKVKNDSGPKLPILNGMASYLPHPEYPEEAKEACAGGKVEVKIVIDEKGGVVSGEALTGHSKLLKPAMEAAKIAKFKVWIPVRQTGILVYDFDSLRYCEKVPVIALGQLNEKARILPMPKYTVGTYIRAGNAVIVHVKIDLQKGTVISAETASGHPLFRRWAVDAARKAVFEPVLQEFRTIHGTGTLIYKAEDFNTATRVNKNPRGFLIRSVRTLNHLAVSLPRPEGIRSGGKFIAGRVEVAVLLPALGGEVLIVNAISGPSELRESSEKAAMGVKFAHANINGAGQVYVAGIVVYNFKENGKVE